MTSELSAVIGGSQPDLVERVSVLEEKLTMALQVAGIQRQRVEASDATVRLQARTIKFGIGGSFLMLVATIVAVGAVLGRYPLERYFITDNAKQICEATLDTRPQITQSTVTEFAKECVLDMDTFAHDSVERDLTRMADRCFNPEFRKVYMSQPWLADRITTVREKLYRVSSQTVGPVLVTKSSDTPHGYMWQVQVPVRRTFRQGEAPVGFNDRVYVVDVFRVTRNAYNPVGLGINQITEHTLAR